MIQEAGDLIAARVKEIAALEMGETPDCNVGESWLSRSQRPFRIVMIPRGGTVVPGGPSGDMTLLGLAGTANKVNRVLWARRVTFEAHVWGKDIATTEQLAGILVRALHDLAGGSHRMSGEAWDTSGETQRGLICVLGFTLDVPWIRKPLELATPTQATITPEVISG